MEIIIKGTPNGIADLVAALQERSESAAKSIEPSISAKNITNDSIFESEPRI